MVWFEIEECTLYSVHYSGPRPSFIPCNRYSNSRHVVQDWYISSLHLDAKLIKHGIVSLQFIPRSLVVFSLIKSREWLRACECGVAAKIYWSIKNLVHCKNFCFYNVAMARLNLFLLLFQLNPNCAKILSHPPYF